MRNSNRLWRVFFWVALAFNLVAGLPLLIAPGAALAAFGVAVPGDLLFHRFTGLLVVCFGVLYALVASDAARFRPLIWLGQPSIAVIARSASPRGWPLNGSQWLNGKPRPWQKKDQLPPCRR